MQTDIYFYGKVCAWILFGQEMSVADFARLPFTFNQAVARQMQTTDTGWEALRDGPAVRSIILSSLEKFFARSFQDLTHRRDQNIGFLMENWKNLCDFQYHFAGEPSATVKSDRNYHLTVSAVTLFLVCETIFALWEALLIRQVPNALSLRRLKYFLLRWG